MLEERDVQLRGFPVRIPLDVALVFSANPEDYTNRGSIITPLRDRIASQILTHYPTDISTAHEITCQEAYTERAGVEIHVPGLLREAIEETAHQARQSDLVDQASGVSVRLPIALLESVISLAERRAMEQGTGKARVHVSDLFAAAPAVTGKIELVFEGEREGPLAVAERLIGLGIEAVFRRYFPAPYARSKGSGETTGEEPEDAYKPIVDWFAQGGQIHVDAALARATGLDEPPALGELAQAAIRASGGDLEADLVPTMELVIEGLHQASLVAKDASVDGVVYGDMLKRMFAGFGE